MSKFTIAFDTNNAAFVDDFDGRDEIGRILRSIADSVEDGSGRGRVVDINGNTVGAWNYDKEGT